MNQSLLLTPQQTAEALNISPRTLWSLTASRQIRCVRIGRCVRYDRNDIGKFIDSQKEELQQQPAR